MCTGRSLYNKGGDEPLPAEKIPITRVEEDNMALANEEEMEVVMGCDIDSAKIRAMMDSSKIQAAGENMDARLAENMLMVCQQDPGRVEVKGEGCNQCYTHEHVFSTPTFAPIMRVFGGLSLFLAVKNMKYGNSALEPKRVFSRASAEEQLLVRLDDKVSRLMNRKEDELAKNDVVDIIGYLILYCAMRGWFSFRDLLD
jgi:hypothetical protein